MSVNVAHNDLTDATTLFTNLAAANEMLNNLSVPAAESASYGVVKKAAASQDTTQVGSQSGISTAENTNIGISFSGTHPTAAEIQEIVVEIVETINHLKAQLRSAGTLT